MTTCLLCDVPLTRVAVPALDDWAYVDPDGSSWVSSGLQREVNRLRDLIDEYHAAGTTAPLMVAAMYSDLSCRAALGRGLGHEHRPRLGVGPDLGPAPEHCDWPMRLRPSGWHCRRCDYKEGT